MRASVPECLLNAGLACEGEKYIEQFAIFINRPDQINIVNKALFSFTT
jgi:hypothetical protein